MEYIRSPLAARTVVDYEHAAATLRRELQGVIYHMRESHDSMEPEAFKRYLRGIGMDEVAAQDFIASDGSIKTMTDRMWIYFESPLQPRRPQTI